MSFKLHQRPDPGPLGIELEPLLAAPVEPAEHITINPVRVSVGVVLQKPIQAHWVRGVGRKNSRTRAWL